MVQIVLGDWGRIIWHRMSEVYLLKDGFKNLSWQGIMCGLAHAGPTSLQHHHLARETKNLCRMLLSKHVGWINIIHPLRGWTPRNHDHKGGITPALLDTIEKWRTRPQRTRGGAKLQNKQKSRLSIHMARPNEGRHGCSNKRS